MTSDLIFGSLVSFVLAGFGVGLFARGARIGSSSGGGR